MRPIDRTTAVARHGHKVYDPMQQTIDPLLLPQMSVTEKRYPIVLQALKEYEQHVDTVGDDALDGYRGPGLSRRLTRPAPSGAPAAGQ